MKLSVMLFPFHGPVTDGSLTPQAAVDAIQSVGIGAIEPMLSNLDATPGPWEQFIDLCRAAGIQVSCVDIGANLVGNNDEEREKALETVRRGLDLWHAQPGLRRRAVAAGATDTGCLTPPPFETRVPAR